MIELTCLRCGHKWIPRTDNPAMCPACKSRVWNKPKKQSKIKHVMVSESKPEKELNIRDLVTSKLEG